MNKSRDYLANELINQKYFAQITDSIENPNKNTVLQNTISTLPPKKKKIIEDRPIYNVISGIEKMENYDFFYKHFSSNVLDSVFFTSNNTEKIKSLFPGEYTLFSENMYIQQNIKNYEQVQEILITNRQFIHWALVNKINRPLLIENKNITLSFITLFVVTEKSIKLYLYNNGLILLQNDIKTLPDDFVNLFGNTFYHDKIIPKVKDILRKGIGKFEKTLIRENGMRFKNNFLLYLPVEVLFEVDMNYNIFIKKLQNPQKYIKEFNHKYTEDINNIIAEPDAPNEFTLIINDTVYIPPEPEQKKVKETENLFGKKTNIVEKEKKDDSYVGELKQDTKNTFIHFFNDLGDFKWVLLSCFIILIISIIILLVN